MISPLRSIHWKAFLILSAILAVTLPATLWVRNPWPSAAPADSAEKTPSADTRRLEGEAIHLDVRFFAPDTESDSTMIEITPTRPVDAPDLLAYWSAGGTTAGQLPEDANFLGRIVGRATLRCRAPEGFGHRPGSLWLYSLAHQRVVERFDLPSLKNTQRGSP